MTDLWNRLPVVVRAILAGLALAASGTLPWAYLVSLNVKYWSAVPWSVPPAVLYLWLWWKYVGGAGWPRSTADARRSSLRARPVPDDAWGFAVLAGILGIMTALRVLSITGRFVTLPVEPLPPELATIPRLTLLIASIMGAAMAGVVEEASFRGYMQVPIERRHGPIVAILVTSTLFWLLHFTHRGFALMLPFYATIAVTYGTMAYLTNSIVPSLMIHTVGDVLGSFMVLAQGQQVAGEPASTLIGTGFDGMFWIALAALVVFGAGTIWAFRALAATRRPSSEPVLT